MIKKRNLLLGCFAFLACLLFAHGSDLSLPKSNEGMPGEGPVRRYDWFVPIWDGQRAMFAADTARDQGAVVFLGDSITQNWGGALWPSFPGMQVTNRGISGDTTRGVLYRLEGDVLAVNPSAVVILIGTNDLEEHAKPKTIAGNLKLILDKLEAHNPEMPIILCAVFPSHASKQRSAEQIQELNRLYRELVKGDEQVIYLDTYSLFANEDGDATIEEFPDLLHPNGWGYKKWAKALMPVFENLGLYQMEPAFELEPGYRMLFNGSNLDGWGYRVTSAEDRKSAIDWKRWDPEGAADWPFVEEDANFDGLEESPDGRFVAVNERLVVSFPAGIRTIQQLWTQEEFGSDFDLKMEFRASPNADSGIYIRKPQLQCRDYLVAGPWKSLEQYRPLEWNEILVEVRGTLARAFCNGEFLYEMEVPESGPIGLEGDRGQMEYRRIRIKEL